jgi:hypothetical protein
LDCFLDFGGLFVVLKRDACTIHGLLGERWTVYALRVDYPLANSRGIDVLDRFWTCCRV